MTGDEEEALFRALEADLVGRGTGGPAGPAPAPAAADSGPVLDLSKPTPAAAVVDVDELGGDDEGAGRRAVDPDPRAGKGSAVARWLGLGGALGAGGQAAGSVGSRRAVLPGWVREPDTMVGAARWAAGSLAHAVLFHSVRVPVYYARLVARSPVGLARLVARWWAWVVDAPGRDVHRAVTAGVVGSRRHQAATGPLGGSLAGLGGSLAGVDQAGHRGYGAGADPGTAVAGRLEAETFLRVAAHHRSAVRGRLAASLAVAAVAVPVAVSVVAAMTAGGRLAACLVVAGLLGVAGRAPDRPVTTRATDSAVVPRLTSDLIERALGSLGLAELNKALRTGGEGIGFPSPIHREGPGWRADIDLPAGVTAGDVAERRSRVASGLRRPLGCVWPEGDGEVHEGRLVLWVGDQPMAKTKPRPWPLAERGAVDLFEAFPLGVDPRGRPVTVTLMFASMVIGALPRMGKSFTLRLLLLAAALDPTAELHVYDLKGGADFLPLAPVAHRFRVGDDAEDLAYLVADLRELVTAMSARYKALRSLPREVCPEGKVTPALARKRDLGLHPVVLSLDECQRAYEDPTHGTEIAALTEDLVKRGPAAGIIAITATQRPDAKSLPTGISANAVLRLCLKVAGHTENNMVLGTGAFQSGSRATMFARSDRGVGYLAGEGDDPVIVRAAYVDADTADQVAARARTARQAAGLLTGHAAGIDPAPADLDVGVLDHLAGIWPAGAARVWCEDLAQLLATIHPGRYDGWTGEQVTAAVKPHGISTVQIKRTVDGAPVNRRGLVRAHLLAALTHRDGEQSTTEDQGD